MKNILKSKWMFLPAVLIGVIAFTLLIKNRAQPVIVAPQETSKTVYVINTPKVDVIPLVHGNGTVKPARVWRSVAEVSGKIVEIHPRLKKGEIITKDETLLKINPTDYELAIAQIQASKKVNEAQLTELDAQKKNTESLLKIESAALALSKKELSRKKEMFKDKTISHADYDREKRILLNQQKSNRSLLNALALYPAQREKVSAELSKLNAQLATAQLNLQRTIIKMPFTGRISEMKIELQQFVRQGETLIEADGIEKAEITVQIPINRMNQLLMSKNTSHIELSQTSREKYILGISARVKLALNDNTAQWDGNVTRISETLDLKTRTVGVVVEVNDPYKDLILGVKPPLMKGMFVSVELTGSPLPNSLIVPRSAIYDSRLHIVNSQNRLETKKITRGLTINGFVVVTSGIKEGDRVIVSNLVPAIQGMLLKPVNDEKTLKTITSAATAGAIR